KTHVDHDLLEFGNGHDVRVLEVFHQRRNHFLAITHTQAARLLRPLRCFFLRRGSLRRFFWLLLPFLLFLTHNLLRSPLVDRSAALLANAYSPPIGQDLASGASM